MRLSELVPHTSRWTGIPETQVKTVARVLQPAGLISSAGKNPRGVEMTIDDKVNLLLGSCGVEIANRAAEYVRVWRRSVRDSSPRYAHLKFAFLEANTVPDLILNLIMKDLNGGALTAWLRQAEMASKTKNHTVTLDFYVDAFALELIVSRNEFNTDIGGRNAKVTTHPISVKFMPSTESLDALPHKKSDEYEASSDLIRRLHEKNLVGWGRCLSE